MGNFHECFGIIMRKVLHILGVVSVSLIFRFISYNTKQVIKNKVFPTSIGGAFRGKKGWGGYSIITSSKRKILFIISNFAEILLSGC